MINLVECYIEGCKAVVSVPKGSTVQFTAERTVFVNNDEIFQERDEITDALYQFLGIDRTVERAVIGELLQSLQAIAPEQRTDAVEKSGIVTKLGSAVTSSTGFVANIVTVAGSPQVWEFIKALLS